MKSIKINHSLVGKYTPFQSHGSYRFGMLQTTLVSPSLKMEIATALITGDRTLQGGRLWTLIWGVWRSSKVAWFEIQKPFKKCHHFIHTHIMMLHINGISWNIYPSIYLSTFSDGGLVQYHVDFSFHLWVIYRSYRKKPAIHLPGCMGIHLRLKQW